LAVTAEGPPACRSCRVASGYGVVGAGVRVHAAVGMDDQRAAAGTVSGDGAQPAAEPVGGISHDAGPVAAGVIPDRHFHRPTGDDQQWHAVARVGIQDDLDDRLGWDVIAMWECPAHLRDRPAAGTLISSLRLAPRRQGDVRSTGSVRGWSAMEEEPPDVSIRAVIEGQSLACSSVA
jgi:hypothetical protein